MRFRTFRDTLYFFESFHEREGQNCERASREGSEQDVSANCETPTSEASKMRAQSAKPKAQSQREQSDRVVPLGKP